MAKDKKEPDPYSRILSRAKIPDEKLWPSQKPFEFESDMFEKPVESQPPTAEEIKDAIEDVLGNTEPKPKRLKDHFWGARSGTVESAPVWRWPVKPEREEGHPPPGKKW